MSDQSLPRLSKAEQDARDRAFKAGTGASVREGQIFDQAWSAARDYYAPNADIANDLSAKLGLADDS